MVPITSWWGCWGKKANRSSQCWSLPPRFTQAAIHPSVCRKPFSTPITATPRHVNGGRLDVATSILRFDTRRRRRRDGHVQTPTLQLFLPSIHHRLGNLPIWNHSLVWCVFKSLQPLFQKKIIIKITHADHSRIVFLLSSVFSPRSSGHSCRLAGAINLSHSAEAISSSIGLTSFRADCHENRQQWSQWGCFCSFNFLSLIAQASDPIQPLVSGDLLLWTQLHCFFFFYY